MDKRRRQQCLFLGILVLAAAVRCIRFAQVPAGINQDEAMAGMDAWALARYGTDRYGIRFPVHFTAWKYGQMSVLLSYCMIPFIRIFGFGAFAIRLPMLLASCGSVVLVYLTGKKLFSDRMALGLMLLVAVNPWHFMQSRWSLDCNLLPHVFLLGFYLLLLGFEKRKFLYLSMVFFGLTLYCYGVAVYSVIPFLAVYAGWCILKKQLRVREVVISALIFLAVALPELLVMAINFFGLPTIETPLFTMSYFPESVRSNDILFLNYSFLQLKKNLNAMLGACILQLPDHLHNAIPEFGPLYDISTPFVLTGIVAFTRDLFREKDTARQTKMMALWGFFLTGVWIGLITLEVNVNRINLIFFPLIFLCGYGIAKVCSRFRRAWLVVAAAYGLCFALFLGAYFTTYAEEIKTRFNVNFLEAVKEADEMEAYEKLYITGHMDWQYNLSMAEILTQYACRIDALYYQERTTVTGGRELLPYGERYHFIDVKYPNDPDPEGLYLLHTSELDKLSFSFEILEEIGNYCLLRPFSGFDQDS
jgi:4-amino-4-deoxy-L-arabinose transferase-like glycosyltransferase